MRKNISIDESLDYKVGVYCKKHDYGFSELVSELLRHRVMGVDITHELHNEPEMARSSMVEQSPVKTTVAGPSPAVPAKPKVPKIPGVTTGDVLKRIAQMKDKPMFCPKHNRMRVGAKYACGCSV